MEISSEEGFIKMKYCDICRTGASKYTCPKCNIGYCSAECYSNIDKHLNCSESFYRSQVFDELKGVKSDSDRKKMSEILERIKNEDFNNEDEVLVEQIENIDLNDEETRRKVVKFYETELYKWRPWFKFDDIVEKSVNKSLIISSARVQISASMLANKFIFYDIIQILYVYIALTYKYQLNLDLDEFALVDEFVENFIRIEDKILTKNLKVDLATRIKLILSNLEAVDDENLKDRFNKDFLNYIIEDLCSIVKFKVKSFFAISHLYDCLKRFSKNFKSNELLLNDDDDVDDKPINVFYLNKERLSRKSERRSNEGLLLGKKEPIIRNVNNIEDKNKNDDFELVKKPNSCLNDSKMLIKRLEFYYQWLKTNENEDLIKESIELLNTILAESRHEETRIKNENEIFKTFLPKLREKINKSDKKKPLIEEV